MNHSTLFTGHNMQDFTFVYRTDNGSFGAKMNKVIMATNHDVWYWIK